jgi:hypothetical protein
MLATTPYRIDMIFICNNRNFYLHIIIVARFSASMTKSRDGNVPCSLHLPSCSRTAFDCTMRNDAPDGHSLYLPGDVQAQILGHVSHSEIQRLRETGPVFLHAALRARYSTVHLDFAQIAKTKSLLSLIHRLR